MARVLQVNQVADAFVAVPGIRVAISDGKPNSDINLGATYTKIMPEDEASISFVAPAAGLYDVRFRFQLAAPTTSTTAKFKLTFDGTDDVGDSDEWEVRVTSSADYDTVVFYGEIELTAGTHTVTAYGIELSGTGAYIPTLSAPVLVLTAVTGSGAGGTILDEAEKTADQSVSTVSVVTLTELGLSFQSSNNDNISIEWNIQTLIYSSSNDWTRLLLVSVDSGAWTPIDYCTSAYWQTFSGSKTVQFAAGSHTVAFGLRTDITTNVLGGDTSMFTSYDPVSSTRAVRYRGGLVPWEKDSVLVSDTPRAINVVGPNTTLTDVDGKLNLEFNGLAEGMQSVEKILSSDFSTSSTSFVDVDNGGGDALTVDIDALEGERVLVALEGYAIHTGGANRIDVQYDVGGTAIPASGLLAESGSSGYSFGLGSVSPIVSPGLSAGSNTIKVQTKVSSNSVVWKAGVKLVVIRYRGGYVQTENIPILEYNSTSVVDVAPGPGAETTLRARLNDGVRYESSATLTIDLTVSGRGGLDTGSEANSTWYYCYLVPDSAGTQLSTVCSVTDPDSGGPTGFDIWRELGAVYNDSSGDIRQFWQMGDWFFHLPDDSATTLVSTDTAAKGSWTNMSTALAVAAPIAIADQVQVRAFMDGDSGQTNRLFVEPGNPPTVTVTPDGTEVASIALANTQDNSHDSSSRIIEIPAGTISYYVNQAGGSGDVNVAIKATAWRASRLTGAKEARSQAAPDLRELVQDQTTNLTLAADDERKTITNSGATGQVDITLPSATSAVGAKYHFVVLAAQILRVVTDSTSDDIRVTGSITAGASRYVEANTVGHTLTLVRASSSLWIATASHGSWTFSA